MAYGPEEQRSVSARKVPKAIIFVDGIKIDTYMQVCWRCTAGKVGREAVIFRGKIPT